MLDKPVRNYAIKDIDTYEKYKKMCKMLNAYPILFEKEFRNNPNQNIFYDDRSENEEFMQKWNSEVDISEFTLLTYDELVTCFYFAMRAS